MHGSFLFEEEVLLGTEDRPRTTYADPSDHRGRWYLVVLHRIEGNQGPCPSEAGLAVDSDGGLVFLGFVEELLDLLLLAVRTG